MKLMNAGRLRELESLILTVLLLALAAWPAKAVINASSNTNIYPPADGAPWGNVGQVNGASGLYVGNGWALTAVHVGPGDIYLNGVVYAYDGTSHRLTNSDGTGTDMVVFHLKTVPPIPRLALTTSTPTALSTVDLIGCGHIAGSPQTSIFPYTGFYWSAGAAKSWGNCTVSVGGVAVYSAGFGNVSEMSTDFKDPTSPAATSNEAEAAGGDSGGGVFEHTSSGWQLVGMIDLITILPGQTNNTAVYGNNTLAADIATYGPQVAAWRASTPPVMTVNRSGTNVLVCWPDIGVNYTLQTSASFSPVNWTTLSPGLTYTNGEVCALLPASGTQKYFRLKTP